MNFDYDLMRWMNTDAFPWLDQPMWWFSTKWFWSPVYALLLFVLYKKYPGKYFIWIVLAIAVCILINDQTASGIFKNWIARLRPSYDPLLQGELHHVLEPNGQIYRGGKFGFYSSHAANMAGVVTLMFLWMPEWNKWKKALLILWVLLIGYSRIYLGVHFPTDVLMGLAMGVLGGWLSFFVWKWTMRKLYPNEAIFKSLPASR